MRSCGHLKRTAFPHGYIVYVLEPSGAIGYGQGFSALHVNDWGSIVVDEIIDGREVELVAWFDRWLKGQPEWWSDLYPDR